MSSIMQVQQGLLNRMEQFESLSQGAAIKPAELGVAQPEAGFEGAFEMALRGVDAEQHKASAAMAAVDSGQSEDLVGAMIQSQQASLSFAALLQVRNKLASAFDDIIRMPL